MMTSNCRSSTNPSLVLHQHFFRSQLKSFFKLRNLPLCIDDIEKLELNAAVYARAMASALAIMHWEVGIDARDVEFVIGPSPTRKTIVRPEHVKGKTMEEARATLAALDFTKPTNRLWLLEFNECKEFSVDEAGWLEQLRQAFEFNDPTQMTMVLINYGLSFEPSICHEVQYTILQMLQFSSSVPLRLRRRT